MKQYMDVDDFLGDLDEDTRSRVNRLRNTILSAIPVTEHIKWNAPSYVFEGEDRVTFSVRDTNIRILIHMGALRKENKTAAPVLEDKTGIVSWSSDIRGVITFGNDDDISNKEADFIDILRRWIATA